MAKNIKRANHATRATLDSLDPDELKSFICNRLVSMKVTEQEDFIQALEVEMRRANLDMRAYLIPLGIPGRSPEDLTPAEVGHLIRFLKMIVPEAMLAVERVTARYGVFAEKVARSVVRLAA
jgi:hypothetical protein